ncbi:biotin--[acetyl-CoA-carboxylase] ligase [Rhodoferax sp.]|uniref:biotin--[acetyl-CoA-carboxylase] ligase n=1 Tax=Rhodoferax sp. TaxID=50421 RepID=UPI00276F47BE|nr:biotin--[acetyl-CoA-carboxylase] ligase [Rhodoferax sp.]
MSGSAVSGGGTAWPREQIEHDLSSLVPGFTVEVVPTIGSTNTELMQRARAGRLEPVLLLAELQTAGRGRLGRQWQSGATASALTFSLGLVLAPADWSGLSLAVGVSLVDSLHPALRLKWPNDLWWRDRKLAGILIETASLGETRYAVVGVGINLAKPKAGDFSTPPAGLGEVIPGVTAQAALRQIAAPLVRAVKGFEATGFAPFKDRFNRCDALAGVDVTLSDGVDGTARGVDERGALLVHTAQGLRKVTSSEVSVRPLRPPDYENI